MRFLCINCVIISNSLIYYMQSLGQRIKLLRERKGIKQQTVAKMLEMSQSNYSRIENEDTEDLTYSKIKKILVAINCTLSDLEEEHNIHNNTNNLIGSHNSNNNVNEIKLMKNF